MVEKKKEKFFPEAYSKRFIFDYPKGKAGMLYLYDSKGKRITPIMCFGLPKAKLLLDCMDDIKKFVEDGGGVNDGWND